MAQRGKLAYKNVADMQAAIDAYFKSCEGYVFTDENGMPVLDKYNQPIIIGEKPPTVTGLALALGFTNRVSLLNYQARSKAFDEVITRAKSRVEAYAESRLFDKDGANGAKFSLQYNFRNWKEEKTATEDADKEIIIVKLERKTQDDADATPDGAE